jgi:hypothetical protein
MTRFTPMPTSLDAQAPRQRQSDSTRVWEQPTYGGVIRHTLDPDRYPTPRLAAELADTWSTLAEEIPGSMRELTTILKAFLDWIGTLEDTGPDFTVQDLRRRHVDAWEALQLERQRSHRTDTPYRFAVYIMALLRRIGDDDPRRLDLALRERLHRESRLLHIRRDGDAELSPVEVEHLRTAASRLLDQALATPKEERPAAPHLRVLVAAHVALSLATGEPPEVLRTLKATNLVATPRRHAPGPASELRSIDDLVAADDVRLLAVTYTKNRARARYEVIYQRRHPAFAVFMTLLTLTAKARRQLGTDQLWLQASEMGLREPTWGERSHSLRTWVDRHVTPTLTDEERGTLFQQRPTFRRLRKTVTTAEALTDPARYLRSQHRHSSRTFFQHYTNSSVLRAQAGDILLQAVNEQFDAAVLGPLVVTPDAEELIANGHSAPGLDPSTSERLLSGELDTPVAACRDPLDSPHADKGDLCPVAANGQCFQCPNALVTQAHLPAALKLAAALHPDRAADPAVWRDRWRDIHTHHTEVIIPAFPADAVAQAQEQADRVQLLDAGLNNDLRAEP